MSRPRRIKLTRNKYALVDYHWYVYLSQWTWYARACGAGQFYAGRTEHYVDEQGHRRVRTVYMHRTVAGTPEGMHCHHGNCNTMDNRECNLENLTEEEHKVVQLGARSSTDAEKESAYVAA